MDFWYRNLWIDPRLIFPIEFWDNINPVAKSEGLDITEYVASSNQLMIWLPDIVFFEGVDIQTLVQLIKLFPNGTIFWSRHILTTLTESQMNLLRYPLDSQNLSLTFQSYAYPSTLLTLTFLPGKAVIMNTDQQLNDILYVSLNNLWSYQSFSAYVQYTPTPVVYDPSRGYITAYINILFQRQSFGVTYRLGLPVTICMVIVGFSFWTELEKRVEVTLQMVLVLAALYLIVGQIIPFVGYFTVMDNFITTVFVLLSFTCGIHFWCMVLERKKEKYPLNRCIGDGVTFLAQAFWIPASMLIFVFYFETFMPVVIACIVVASTICIGHAFMRRSYMWRSVRVSVALLREKAVNALHHESLKRGSVVSGELGKLIKLTTMERFVLYLFDGYVLSNYENAEESQTSTTESTEKGGCSFEMPSVNGPSLSAISVNNLMNSNVNSVINSVGNASVTNHARDIAPVPRVTKRLSTQPRSIPAINDMDSDDDF